MGPVIRLSPFRQFDYGFQSYAPERDWRLRYVGFPAYAWNRSGENQSRFTPESWGSYRSSFSHEEEVAEPGYYAVLLRDYGIHAELSATKRAGIHRYTFPESDSSHFILDLVHHFGRRRDPLGQPHCLRL